MLSFIVMYPAAAFTAAALALVGLYYFIAFGGRVFIITLMVLALAPLWPILAVRYVAVKIVDLCDWLIADRIWTAPFVGAARYLEHHLSQPRR